MTNNEVNKNIKPACYALTLFLTSISLNAFGASPIIYGTDNRKDFYEVTDPNYIKLMDSTVALVHQSKIEETVLGITKFKSMPYGKTTNLCIGERYFDQPSTADCSGSLVGEDLILTAGHCIQDQSDCEKTNFVFGYQIRKEGAYPDSVPSHEVYRCSKLIYKKLDFSTGEDIALVKLTKTVLNHEILRVNRAAEVTSGTELILIGYPVGIPEKIDDQGFARENRTEKEFFHAELDAFTGNSGGPVFNKKTGLIEGVLVRGPISYTFDEKRSCFISRVLPHLSESNEEVMKIRSIFSLIP